ncbi:hypothetical protein [Mycobacterium sherrisii]|uniref:Uncharacterized protein n=1 Tax=Mycobacterium sherrisii TaxID=243061 RepID=A0A1E3SD51_9MYCO|nr:hypothetical protein [Mycobacterium sherrisii]MCV7031019.1 hypothetical protein [Mycobacterium sherrisii]ODQ99991.1 hypothetical protein BHQ21_24805 [Mycobacterium sherrisii]ORW77968.1 hypothetical protein AWC25_07350 [Mycobacterium sherrisii]
MVLAGGVRLRAFPWWVDAVENLRNIANAHRVEAQVNADAHAGVYTGKRGAMIVDVVASRQRNYLARVRPIVARWEAANEQHSIYWLAEHPLDATQFGLSEAEAVTILEVARNLRGYAVTEGLPGPREEDAVCSRWAQGRGQLEHAPRLDPVVGCVKGIGLALFAYMRMRSGADAIKPDIRVKKALRHLGFAVPDDDHAVLILAKAAAEEIRVSRLVLDQLLWRFQS